VITKIDIDEWSDQTKYAYVAAIIETDGWVGLISTIRKDNNSHRIIAYVGLTNQNIELLQRVATIMEVPYRVTFNGRAGQVSRGIITTRKDTFQSVWRSPIHIIPFLEKIIPYMTVKRDRAIAVLEFAKGRITKDDKVHRRSKLYNSRDFELVTFCKKSYNEELKVKLP